VSGSYGSRSLSDLPIHVDHRRFGDADTAEPKSSASAGVCVSSGFTRTSSKVRTDVAASTVPASMASKIGSTARKRWGAFR
jgi:hypothetical protein